MLRYAKSQGYSAHHKNADTGNHPHPYIYTRTRTMFQHMYGTLATTYSNMFFHADGWSPVDTPQLHMTFHVSLTHACYGAQTQTTEGCVSKHLHTHTDADTYRMQKHVEPQIHIME